MATPSPMRVTQDDRRLYMLRLYLERELPGFDSEAFWTHPVDEIHLRLKASIPISTTSSADSTIVWPENEERMAMFIRELIEKTRKRGIEMLGLLPMIASMATQQAEAMFQQKKQELEEAAYQRGVQMGVIQTAQGMGTVIRDWNEGKSDDGS